MYGKEIKLVILFLLTLSLLVEAGNPVKIKGQVISYKDYKPLPFASIIVKSTGKGTVSSELGYFDLEVPTDTATIIVTYMGFKTKEVKLNPMNVSSIIFIKLEENVQFLEEVTVALEKERIIRVAEKQISTVKMSPILVARLPNFGEVDILRSFQLLPGVSATNETSAGLYVRGGTPDQNLILFDGMTIYHVDHFYGFFSAFNANTIDDIELIKGGFPAEYGGRTSSVMNITGKPASLDKASGGGSISLLSINSYLELPLIKNKLSWQFAARRSYTDIIRTGLYNKIFNMYQEENEPANNRRNRNITSVQQDPKFHFYDINSKITYKLNENNLFALSLYNGKDKLDNSRTMTRNLLRNTGTETEEREIKDLSEWGNTGLSTQWIKSWNNNFESNLFISYSNYFKLRNIKRNITTPGSNTLDRPRMNSSQDNYVEDISFRFKNSLNINQSHTLKFGFEHSYSSTKYDEFIEDTSNIDKNNEGNQSSFYVQDDITFSNKLNLNVGVRSNYFDITEKFYFEPRLSLIYEPLSKLKIKAAWGQYHQFISRIVKVNVLQGSEDHWLLADGETIPVSSSDHYIAGLSYAKNNMLFDIEAFYKDMRGLTEYSERFTGNPRRNRGGREEYYFEGTGYTKGIEFLIQKKYGLNTGWIGYTLSEVKHTFPDLNYGKEFYALHDQTHEFKTVYTRRIKNWDISAAFIYATGKPYTSPESKYELTLLDGTSYNYIHVSDKNTLRLPDYNRLDVSASYNWTGQHAENTLSLSVFNIYNRKNTWYKEFEIDENDIIVTDFILLGTTPNISLTVKF